MSDLLKGLNQAQTQAVSLPPAHALILAGAGSGKTRVLTTRIAWLLQTGQAGPQSILAVTFTNKAAKEMLLRLSAMLPVNIRGMWIGTFHGLCNRLLRAHYRDAGLPQLFQILDSADQLSAIKRLLKTLQINDDNYPPREIQYYINANKEQGVRAAQVDAWDNFTRQKQNIYSEYERQCEREGVVDFAELMLRSYELLQRNQPLREHYQRRFRFVLVDEFQDTNALQYRWLKVFVPATVDGDVAGGKLFCVGDDDQSIYRFRGADVGNMREFEREYNVDCVIRLEQNYRSYGNILDAANAVITNNTDRLGKSLWTANGGGELLRLYQAFDDQDEARWVVEEIQQLIREGEMRSDIALLYRSNAQSRMLEHKLFSAAIPYRVYGGLRFFERQEVKHALAYLRLIANADDDTAFTRVVNFPARGIGARSLEALQDAARTWNSSLYAAVANLGGKASKSLAQFVLLIERLRAETRTLSLADTLDHVYELSGLRGHYEKEKEGGERLENLAELVNAAIIFSHSDSPFVDQLVDEEKNITETEHAKLAEFLAHASLEAGDNQADAGSDAVQLMTVHSAKGLEFKHVFVTGLEESLFPHENSINESGGLEEERRLMYVALTRAKERLYLLNAQSRMLHGQFRHHLPSRFITEIPPQLIKNLSPARAGESAAFSAFANAPASSSKTAMLRNMGNETGLSIGQAVHHAKFGQGVVVAAEGRGEDARLQVNFGRNGLKWLMMSVAKLTAVL